MFAITLIIAVSHLPFFAAYAVSYPFIMYSARYWLTVAPYTENPRPGPKIVGLMLVTHQEARLRSVDYYLPFGRIEVRVGDEVGKFKAEFVPYLPGISRSPC
jgi:hypothetical protein